MAKHDSKRAPKMTLQQQLDQANKDLEQARKDVEAAEAKVKTAEIKAAAFEDEAKKYKDADKAREDAEKARDVAKKEAETARKDAEAARKEAEQAREETKGVRADLKAAETLNGELQEQLDEARAAAKKAAEPVSIDMSQLDDRERGEVRNATAQLVAAKKLLSDMRQAAEDRKSVVSAVLK